MKPQYIFKKIVNKLSIYFFRLLNRDLITLSKITQRNDLRQIGTEYGGWVVPTDLLNANSVCYCVGCGEDISFDLGLIEQFGCDVFAFDPTPRAIKYVKENTAQNTKYHFFELGLWDKEDILKFYVPKNPKYVSHSFVNLQKTEDYIEVQVARLSKIMEDNEHDKLDLLKLDIEGAEYRVIESFIKNGIDIKILCVEFDECFNALDKNFKQRIRKSVNKLLTLGYSLVCAQGNGNYTFVKDI
jgi:FkbM family methyltransferase